MFSGASVTNDTRSCWRETEQVISTASSDNWGPKTCKEKKFTKHCCKNYTIVKHTPPGDCLKSNFFLTCEYSKKTLLLFRKLHEALMYGTSSGRVHPQALYHSASETLGIQARFEKVCQKHNVVNLQIGVLTRTESCYPIYSDDTKATNLMLKSRDLF